MLAVSSLALPALRSAYRVQQASLRLPLTWTRALLGPLVGDRAADPEAIAALQREYAKLLEADLANVERGAYPASLLFQMPVRNYATRLPWLLLDLPRTFRRFRERAYEDLPDDVRPVAMAPDGTVEAVEHVDLPQWGIMWHPERDPFDARDAAILGARFRPGGAEK